MFLNYIGVTNDVLGPWLGRFVLFRVCHLGMGRPQFVIVEHGVRILGIMFDVADGPFPSQIVRIAAPLGDRHQSNERGSGEPAFRRRSKR